jgi:uncharacterized membrane protein YfcA
VRHVGPVGPPSGVGVGVVDVVVGVGVGGVPLLSLVTSKSPRIAVQAAVANATIKREKPR